jgi:anti-sigma regulatory factor (Ser/Thr protein kinase)
MPLKPPDESALTWLRLPGRPESLEPFRAFILERAGAEVLPQGVRDRIDLVIEEVLLNIFHYAFEAGQAGIVAVGCGAVPDKGFMVRVIDPGRPFDPLRKPDPDLTLDITERPVGGLGILLAKEMSSDMAYCRDEDRNILDIYFQHNRTDQDGIGS